MLHLRVSRFAQDMLAHQLFDFVCVRISAYSIDAISDLPLDKNVRSVWWGRWLHTL
jgi:hypothetical protein